jgi:hypothetical protein
MMIVEIGAFAAAAKNATTNACPADLASTF